MSKVIISADSTCDISNELIEKYGIKICRGPVILGDKEYTDGIDITPKDIFEYYNTTGNLAKTSATNFQTYYDYLAALAEGGNKVIHFCISSEMSSMYNNCRMAGEDLDGVFVIDSRNLSTGIGLMVILAAELAESGMEAEAIVEKINETIPKVDASFVIDTLTYLHKGGRCSTVAMIGAIMLKLRPCIEVKEGKMDVGKKFRGKMSDVLIEYAKSRLGDLDSIDPHRCFVTHTMELGDEKARAVYDYVESLGYFDEIIETTAGCTVTCHCGPGTRGVLFVKK